ncbi:hypothetical protein SPRG_06663 [Saprolegnia parasitica CBS 223.65]|uniref:Dynein heavy chain n=1 Tax=Saprolegnia parasitica (strain CBS 223.65) TaxID=695850 RepID=A0A067CPG0_SAPPC|nr:hypothetical protein SPRG_06663 [Saprolegnia parasitica CBS 223.65]KDO28426.1 hypothetical protein SPRG_06663 [Saprolegnia parasitica CBS 223.65]|eukprot:XP_012200867.1 hypothetical protein SPRG_06663 [Saprolegnia parasitica CBS 223.65]
MDAGGSSSRVARLSARQEMEEVDPYSQSNQWIEAAEYHRLSQLVAAEKEAEARAAHAVPAFVHTKQTWQTPLHVPMPKRKVAQMALPEGLKPMAPPSNNGARPSQRTRRLQEHGQTIEQRASLEKLKDDNQELYAKLVARFRPRTPAAGSPVKVGSLASVHCIEDAVLYFLCEKHRRNVLYFSAADPARGRPYDLTPATSGKGEHYVLSSKHVVHVKPREPAECIPIAEWVYHSRMFDHLLRSIPLFQQLLRRRMFMYWQHYVRQRIYRRTRANLLAQLHCGRPMYALALREIQSLSHCIQSQRALCLDATKPSMSLAEWRSAQAAQFKELEAQLVDARAGAHHALVDLVAAIQSALTPDTTLAALNAADMFEMRQAYPGWKSIPMAHLKAVTRDQARQVQQAQKDLAAFPAFLRLTQYIFVQSLYAMVMASVTQVAAQLSQEVPRSLTVAVSFLQDARVRLTPSDADVLRFLRSAIESLTTLSSGFASSRSAAVYLKSDEVVGPSSPPPRLHDALHASAAFPALVVALESSVRATFARVSQQVEQFNGLRPIYTAMLALTLPTIDEATYLAQLPTLVSAISTQVMQLDAWQGQCHRIQASWDVGFVDVHCRHVLSEVLERITAQRTQALDVLGDVTSRGVMHCVTHLKDAITRLVLDAEMTLVSEMRQVDDAFGRLKSLAPPMAAALQSAYNSIHATYAKYNVSLQANLKFTKSMLPQIAKQIVTLLQRYAVQCKKLSVALQANGTYLHSPSSNVDFDAKHATLRDIKAELDKITEASDQYNDYQSVMGMKVTPVALLEATKSLYAEVHEVWDLSHAWKQAYAGMLQAKFVSQPWASHVETTRAFLERAHQVHCRFENRIFASVQAEMATVLAQLPLLVELGADYMKESHWTQIFKVLGTTPLHVPSMTLQQLDDALVWRHAEKLSQIAYHARIDAETEATLAAMKARWAVTELPCADAELDSLVVGDLLLALDDDLVQVQALLQRTSQPSLYTSLSVWSDEINYIQDTLELWLSTQTDWLQLDRLFALPDVQANVRHANVEFQAVSRKWRGMMKGVRSTTSLQQCVREVTNRAFLSETKQLFERLWKQLANFLQDKRRAFPRLNFVSDRQLLAIMAATTESLRDPSDGHCRHVSTVLRICFEHILEATVKVRATPNQSLLGSTLSADDFPTGLTPVASVGSLDIPEIERNTTDIVCVGGKYNEVLTLESPITVTQRPELWMQDLLKALHQSLRDCVRDVASDDATNAVLQLYIDGDNRADMTRAIKRMEHVVAKYPLQVLLLAFRIYFTGDCSQVVAGHAAYTMVRQQQLCRANEWVAALKAATTDKQRHACSTLALCCFNHAELLGRLHATPHAAFEWSQQRQYRWGHESQTVLVTHGLKTYEYGFEYLGPHATIALTPLTERIMWSVSMAFRLHAGGLVHGETGVSKQVAIRELVASLGSLLITYDCSIQLSETQFHRVLSGLMPCQAYALIVGLGAVDDASAIGRFLHELRRLQHALKTHKDKILMESSHVPLHAHDRSSVNFGIVCKLTLSTPVISPLVERCARAFLPIAASFEMLDALLVARLCLSAAGFLHAESLATRLHAFLLTSEAVAGGDRVTVRTIKKIVDLAKAYGGENIDEGHAVAWAIQRAMGARVAPSLQRAFLQQLRERFPTYRDVELDITKTQARIQDAIAAAHLVLTPVLSRKVHELHHLCGHHAVNIITGAVGTGKSTIVHVLSTVRRTYGESAPWDRARCYRITSATLRTTEFYGHFAPETNEWVDGIRDAVARFDGDVADACMEPLYAISDETPHVHLPNGERLDTSYIKLFFEASTLERWSPAALNRFGVLTVPSDAVPYTVYIKAWLLRQSLPPSSSRHVDAAKGCAQLLRSHLPSLLQVGREYWQAHVPFHAPTLVQKLLEIVDSFFHDAPTIAKDVVLIYLVACAWSIGAYIDEDARALFHDVRRSIRWHFAPELARHRLFASGRTIFDVYLENDKGKVALVTWQSQMPRMDWASLVHHRFVFVPNEATLRTEHLVEFFASTRRHALLLGAHGVGKSASAQRSLWQLGKRGCVERVVVDLERKMKGLYGPTTGKTAMVYLVEDLHLGSSTSHEQLRQVLDTSSVYDRRTFDVMQLQHCAFLALLSVPTTTSLSLRLLRHFHVVWQPHVPPRSLHAVFRPLATYMAEHFSTKYTAEMAWQALQLPLQVLELLVQEPRDASFARFSLGDLVLVYSHVLRANQANLDAKCHLESLVFNVTSVVFGSRCTRGDAIFFKKLVPSVATTLDYDAVSYVERPLYGDKTDGLGYIPLTSREAIGLFIKGHEKFQWHHPAFQSPLVQHLAPFPEAIDAMLAMLFALGDLRQHLLLLGPRGVGKRTSLVVVCGILSYNYVEIRRGHDVEARLREVLVQVGTHGKHTVLYIAIDELDAASTRLVLNLVRDGDVPLEVYSTENMDAIADGMAQLPSLANTNPSRAQCLSLYRAHLATYLHVAVATRTEARLATLLAQTSGLLDACTLRVFSPWSALAFGAIYESMNVLPTLQPVVWAIHAAYLELRPGSSASRNPASQFKQFVLGLASYHVERTKAIHDTRASYSHGPT